MTLSTAGDDHDLNRLRVQSMVAERRDSGDRLLARARSGLRSAQTARGRDLAEKDARRALERYARSLDWAEDTDDEQDAHDRLDAAGGWVRRAFGCHLHREGETYSQQCPVALAHNRIGLSIGGVATRICSLCGKDLSDCEHQRGTAYIVPGGTEPLGWCRVCLSKDGCGHPANEQYRVSLVSIITEMDLAEVSLVSKPANPEARLTSVSISTSELQDHLGDDFSPGQPVNCDRCLRPCAGLERPDLSHG